MKITHLLIFSIVICNKTAIAMESDHQYNTHLMVIPGQNGCGGQNIDTVLPYFANKKHLKHNVQTPKTIIDLGQNRCQSYLHKKMSTLKKNDKAIVYASSQGTATAGSYTAKNPKKIGALILEAVMLSGNSAIHYNTPPLSSIPGSYYWLPYAAKTIFPFYAPAGDQLILNAHKLPKDLPIIILHHTKDFQLPYQDAQALYAFLRFTQKNNNVYLMPKNSSWKEHVLLLQNISDANNVQKINAINKILHQHGLLPESKELLPSNVKNYFETEDNNYQPQPQQKWLDHFNEILNKEKKIWYIDWGVKMLFYGLLVYVIYKRGLAEKFINQAHILHNIIMSSKNL